MYCAVLNAGQTYMNDLKKLPLMGYFFYICDFAFILFFCVSLLMGL